jgi:hypothetical protein
MFPRERERVEAMSRRPEGIHGAPPPPDGFFGLTQWRRIDDGEARAARARFALSLAAQGILTLEQEFNGFVRLCRGGEEAISDYGLRERAWKRGQRKTPNNP